MMLIKQNMTCKKKKKTRFFTLLEVMICVAILLITASFFTYKLSEVLALNKTQKSIKTIASRIDLCKRLAFLEQSDVIFKLYPEKDKLICQVGTEGDQGIIVRKKPLEQKFSGIDFSFDGSSDFLEISFSSTGSVYPTGTLTLTGPKNRVKKEIPVENKYISTLRREESYPLHPKDAQAFKDKNKPVEAKETVSTEDSKPG